MKLFLSSAGIKPETKESFLKLLGKNPKEMTVAFIPTACDPEPDKSYVQWTIDQIEEVGLKCFTVDLKGENENSLKKKLEKADIICVNGGNTFYLLDQVKKSGFDKIIRSLLNKGKIYFGVSAGSYIACSTIEAAKWKKLGDPDVVGSNDLSSIRLCNFLIVAHYSEKYYDDVERGATTTKYPVVALTDQQAVIVNGDKIQIAGAGQKNIFNGFKES
jgi:dipeptidase E